MESKKSFDLASTAREFVKYFLASALALLVDYGTYWALARLKVLDLPGAAVAGYTVGLTVAYGLISRGVFANGWLREKRRYEVLLFALSGLLGIGLTYLAVFLFVSIFGESIHGAKLVAVGISFVGVYLFRKAIVFRNACSPQ